LTDFHNSFTDVLSWNCEMKLLIKIPPHPTWYYGYPENMYVIFRQWQF